MDIPRNAFKRALAEGRRQIGIWSSLGSNVVAEILAPAGFDWVLLDMEHSPNEIPGLIQQMQALAGGTATPIVRPAWNDPVVIKRVLDAGAQSILVPFVQNAAEARAAVAATRYPPHGIRGVSGLARRPGQRTAADHMHMQVKHGLTSLSAGIDHGAKALQALLFGHLGGHQQQMAQQRGVAGVSLGQIHHGLPGDHQHVHRRLGSHIAEGDAELVGIHLVAGDLTPQDLAEDRVVGHGTPNRVVELLGQ